MITTASIEKFPGFVKLITREWNALLSIENNEEALQKQKKVVFYYLLGASQITSDIDKEARNEIDFLMMILVKVTKKT